MLCNVHKISIKNCASHIMSETTKLCKFMPNVFETFDNGTVELLKAYDARHADMHRAVSLRQLS